MRTRKKLTMDQHRALGAQLKAARKALLPQRVLAPNTYGLHSAPSKVMAKLIAALDAAKSEMENQMFRDYPWEDDCSVYYSNGKDDPVLETEE